MLHPIAVIYCFIKIVFPFLYYQAPVMGRQKLSERVTMVWHMHGI
jgi:hypothetical protein